MNDYLLKRYHPEEYEKKVEGERIDRELKNGGMVWSQLFQTMYIRGELKIGYYSDQEKIQINSSS